MGMDNVIVELDNLELPILDGSALPYVQAFLRVGIHDAAAAARVHPRAASRSRCARATSSSASIPGTGYRIDYTIDFPAPIGRQCTCIDLAAETYGAEIAPARTFGYKADEQKLRDMGLIRGASRGERDHSGRTDRKTGRCVSTMSMCGTRCWT